MNGTLLTKFLVTVALFVVLGFVVGAVAGPPDPFSQILVAAAVVAVALPVSYWLVYRNGWSRLSV